MISVAGKPRPEPRHVIHFRAWRQASGLTQRQVSERLDVAISSVANWDRGRPPYLEFLPDIAELFGCTIDQLFQPPQA